MERLLSGLQYLPVIVHIPCTNHVHSFIICTKQRSRSGDRCVTLPQARDIRDGM